MNQSHPNEEACAWRNLASALRSGVADAAGEEPPFGFCTAVMAQWREQRERGEYLVLERLSLRMAFVASAASLVLGGAWLWKSSTDAGDAGSEWVELPPWEDVAW